MFKKAVREAGRLRLALTGPAGSGKTSLSLQSAKGLGGKISMIDIERGSGALYANSCDDEVLIIDSLSYAWAGEGGILTTHDRA